MKNQFEKKWKKITLVLLLLLAFFYVYKTVDLRKKPTETYIPPSNPKISSIYTGSLPITLDLKNENFVFPKKLPGIMLKTLQIDENKAKEIARKLGNAFEPTSFSGKIKGKTLIWNGVKTYLSISLDFGKVEYTTGIDVKKADKVLDDNSITSIALNFLEKNLPELLPDYKTGKIEYLSVPEGEGTIKETDRENANVFRVNLNPKVSNLELISSSVSLPESFIDFLPNGEIVRLEISNITSTNNTKTEYEIKNFEDLQNTLSQAKLIYFDSETEEILEFPKLENIKSISINSIKIAYFIDSPGADFYKPIFILEGPAQLNNYPQDTIAHMYLPAFK